MSKSVKTVKSRVKTVKSRVKTVKSRVKKNCHFEPNKKITKKELSKRVRNEYTKMCKTQTCHCLVDASNMPQGRERKRWPLLLSQPGLGLAMAELAPQKSES